MEKSKKSINVEGGYLFCGGWNFSKSVSVGSTFIREMRVLWFLSVKPNVQCNPRLKPLMEFSR